MKEDRQNSRKLNIAANQFLKEKEYWLNHLSGNILRSYFPYDYKESSESNGDDQGPGAVTFTFSQEIFARLTGITGGSYPKLHMILAAALVVLLARYSGNDDIIVGTTVDKQNTDGLLINTILPLRLRLTDNISFKELIFQVRTVLYQAIENQNYPIETLVSQLNLASAPTADQFPLFDVAVLLENLQDKKYIQHIDIGMIFSFAVGEGYIEGEVCYDTRLYERASVGRIVDHFLHLLRDALFNVDRGIANIDILSDEEKQRFKDFNDTQADYPVAQTVHRLFEQQALETPDYIAIEDSKGTRRITYRQLNNSAGRLANRLRKEGVGPGSIIGILADRSVEAVAAILGVLKTGGAFLPIDTDYPPERKKYILNDGGATLLLTQKVLTGDMDWKGKILIIENEYSEKDSDNKPLSESETEGATSSDLAYIIYTSGSTGKPKGVMIEHRSIVNYILFAAKNYVKNEKVNFPLFTSIAFDLTLTSLFTPLVTGNTIIVYGDWEEGNLLEKMIDNKNVGVIKLTPSHLNLIRYKKIGKNTQAVKRLIVGGEKLDTRLARDIHENFNSNIHIYNEYGPTEATVGCMIYEFNPENNYTSSVLIGKPLDNLQIFLLDRNRVPVPIGAVGEIYISGAGVARGYLKRTELTAERFVPNPFKKGTVMYRTGDLARWWGKNDLMIEFLGRRDHQVKVGGFRIELGEIESYLARHEYIKEAVVIARETMKKIRHEGGGEDIKTGNYLCAYFVSDNPLEAGELREYLLGQLPHYMVPSHYIKLDSMPLTTHGKLDIKSLPGPLELMEAAVEYCPPTSEKERLLTEIWQDVLGEDKIGIDDPYFSLGGDSINAIQIAARLQNHKLKLDLKYLYQYPTIRALANYVQSTKEVPFQGIVEGEIPLTPIQLWFFQLPFRQKHYFNQSLLLHSPEGFEEKIVEVAFNKLVDHHDALRMVFKVENGQIKQFNRGIAGSLFNIHVYKIEEKKYEKIIEENCNQIHTSMDLDNGPLVKLGLFKTVNGDYLLISIHHLVMDGVSWRILLEDFMSFYKQIREGEKIENLEAPFKSTPFKEWAEKLYIYANGRKLKEEIPYWQNIEQTEIVPFPRKPGVEKPKPGGSREAVLEFSEEYTDKLLKEVYRAYKTEINDILLAALGLAITDCNGGEKAVIELEGHGREEIIKDTDVSRTIGWFTSIYPVVLDMTYRDDLSLVIKNTKEMLRRIPDRGIGYGILKYLTGEVNKQGMEFRLNPEIGFNYLGQFDEELKTPLYQVADISAGDPVAPDAVRTYPLYIIGWVYSRKLRMSVTYDEDVYDEKSISTFTKKYKNRLHQIIDYCIKREETELTASDFTSPIEEQEAEEVFDILSEIVVDA